MEVELKPRITSLDEMMRTVRRRYGGHGAVLWVAKDGHFIGAKWNGDQLTVPDAPVLVDA